jgi:hypothetical protein
MELNPALYTRIREIYNIEENRDPQFEEIIEMCQSIPNLLNVIDSMNNEITYLLKERKEAIDEAIRTLNDVDFPEDESTLETARSKMKNPDSPRNKAKLEKLTNAAVTARRNMNDIRRKGILENTSKDMKNFVTKNTSNIQVLQTAMTEAKKEYDKGREYREERLSKLSDETKSLGKEEWTNKEWIQTDFYDRKDDIELPMNIANTKMSIIKNHLFSKYKDGLSTMINEFADKQPGDAGKTIKSQFGALGIIPDKVEADADTLYDNIMMTKGGDPNRLRKDKK